MSPVPTLRPDQFETIFIFMSKILFFNISIFESRTGACEASTVLTQRSDQFPTISIFRSKFFFLTSRFLKFQVSTLPTRWPYLFWNIFILGRNFFFFNILISECRTGASEIFTVRIQNPEQFATIFIFR